jgi:hypothetical protein
MGKTLEVAADRATDERNLILPAEVARGIYIRNAPSAQTLKLLYLLCAKAGGRMADDTRHEITLAEIRRVDGMRNHDRASLRELFIELRGAVLTYDNAVEEVEVIGGFVDEVRLDYSDPSKGNLMVQWWYGRTFRRMAEQSDLWAVLDRQTLFALRSKYSILLFQHIASLVNLKHVTSKQFSMSEIRDVMGLTDTTLSRFADFNARALAPALAEICQLSRFDVKAKFRKQNRTVVAVEIHWTPKADTSTMKEELARPKVGRKARRDGTVERAVVAFPVYGGLSSTDKTVTHWRALFTQHVAKIQGRHLPDSKVVCDAFRKAVGRDDLDGPNIEKRFIAFCSSWRG